VILEPLVSRYERNSEMNQMVVRETGFELTGGVSVIRLDSPLVRAPFKAPYRRCLLVASA
jgi:hypothetical protein